MRRADKLVHTAAMLVLLFATVPAARLAAEARPAEVSALEGSASRTSIQGERAALKERSAVGEGDTLETAQDSRLELRFADRSVLRLGPAGKLQLTAAHFGGGPTKRKLNARLFFGSIWAKVTSVVSGDQKFQVETENAVAGVRGTTFRVDARADKSVLVRVYAGAVAVARNVPIYTTGQQGDARREVAGPGEVARDQWEKLVGKQMEILIAADGTPGEPTPLRADAEQDDAWAKWNAQRDAAAK